MKQREIQILLLSAGLVSAAVAAFTYFQSRTKNKLQEDIAYLDKQIKSLELADRLNKHSGSEL